MLYVDEGSVLTSAGVAAGLDLCLHVIRRDHGSAVAAELARRVVIAPHREGGQAQFIPAATAGATIAIAPGQSTELARTWALTHLEQPLPIAALASRAAMSTRTFARRFLAETGTTPAQWVLEQRLRAAQTLLETTADPVEHVAHRSGFGNAAALRAHFARRLQQPPPPTAVSSPTSAGDPYSYTTPARTPSTTVSASSPPEASRRGSPTQGQDGVPNDA